MPHSRSMPHCRSISHSRNMPHSRSMPYSSNIPHSRSMPLTTVAEECSHACRISAWIGANAKLKLVWICFTPDIQNQVCFTQRLSFVLLLMSNTRQHITGFNVWCRWSGDVNFPLPQTPPPLKASTYHTCIWCVDALGIGMALNRQVSINIRIHNNSCWELSFIQFITTWCIENDAQLLNHNFMLFCFFGQETELFIPCICMVMH